MSNIEYADAVKIEGVKKKEEHGDVDYVPDFPKEVEETKEEELV